MNKKIIGWIGMRSVTSLKDYNICKDFGYEIIVQKRQKINYAFEEYIQCAH
jgi:hypothetical protein